jgi:hypothetical protein
MNKVDRMITSADTLANWWAGLRRALPWGFCTWLLIVILGSAVGKEIGMVAGFLLGSVAATYVTYRVYRVRMVQFAAMDPTERQVFLMREDNARHRRATAAAQGHAARQARIDAYRG